MGKFDVFMCHNSDDKPEVIKIAEQLRNLGIKPWLDQWELRPGRRWILELDRQITDIDAAAVFVGGSGDGPWQSEEIDAILIEFKDRKCPIIPVLLESAPAQPRLPIFLRGRMWVDFRVKNPDPLQQLIWGIKDKPIDLGQSRSALTNYVEELGNGIKLEMLAIPGGEFMMGSPKGEGEGYEYPRHRVTVPPFFMSKYPVTQEQWLAVMNDFEEAPRFRGDKRPIDLRSEYSCEHFCKALSQNTGKQYRLPSEAEWEYACRAGTTTPFYFGEELTIHQANFGDNIGKTTEVGIYPANAFGLHDMHGNIWERCEDKWHEDYEGAPTDGSAWSEIRNWDNLDNFYPVVRGGFWGLKPKYCRSASRYYFSRVGGNYVIGFRVACSYPRT
jgi:formylglycine-generating enzyme required for sulfatase activity